MRPSTISSLPNTASIISATDANGCRPNAATSTRMNTSRPDWLDARGRPPSRVALRARRSTRGPPVCSRWNAAATDSLVCAGNFRGLGNSQIFQEEKPGYNKTVFLKTTSNNSLFKDYIESFERDMAPSGKRGRPIASRHLVCGTCSSWVDFDSSGCINSWGQDYKRFSSMSRC